MPVSQSQKEVNQQKYIHILKSHPMVTINKYEEPRVKPIIFDEHKFILIESPSGTHRNEAIITALKQLPSECKFLSVSCGTGCSQYLTGRYNRGDLKFTNFSDGKCEGSIVVEPKDLFKITDLYNVVMNVRIL